MFFDFDDTLFPTAHLFDQWGLPSDCNKWDAMGLPGSLTLEQRRACEDYEIALVRYLSVACSLSSHVVIITNASEGWVQKCVETFAPKAVELFGFSWGPKIVHAECVYKKSSPRRCARIHDAMHRAATLTPVERRERLTYQKFLAMKLEAQRFYGSSCSGKGSGARCWQNILGFGDMPYEQDALRELAFQRTGPVEERLRVKIQNVPLARHISSLTWHLEVERLLLPALVRFDGDLNMDMQAGDWAASGCHGLAKELGLPELWPALKTLGEPPTEPRAQATVAALRRCARLASPGRGG